MYCFDARALQVVNVQISTFVLLSKVFLFADSYCEQFKKFLVILLIVYSSFAYFHGMDWKILGNFF